MTTLGGNAPNRFPALMATAQVKFDCWVEEQDEGWQQSEIAECRKGFETAMATIDQQSQVVAPKPAPAPAAMAPMNYQVFFDFDKSTITTAGMQVVMVIDAAALLSRYSAQAAVSPFNTGNARRRPASRGRPTFVPYLTWCESGWQHEATGLGTRPRSTSHRPAELTVNGAVPDVMDFVVDIRRVASGEKCTF